MQEPHRPGPLKQQNKRHKTRHRTGHQLLDAAKGKVDVKTLSKKSNRESSRDDRRNQMKQHRKLKQQETFALKRSIGSDTTPPILVAVHNRSSQFKLTSLLNLIEGNGDIAVDRKGPSGPIHVSVRKFKLRYTFITVPDDDLYALMDAVKVVDILLLIHSLDTDSNDIDGDPFLNAIYSHFLPTTVHVVNGLDSIPARKRNTVKLNIEKAIEIKFPQAKVHVVDKEQEAQQLLYRIGNCKRREMSFRTHRSNVLAEDVVFENVAGEEKFKMIVTGYVRSRSLNVNSLIHIPGYGDYQIEQIETLPDPHLLHDRIKKSTTDSEMMNLQIIKPDVLLQESLERENEIDPMEGEQTFPTAEEIAEAVEKSRNKTVKRVPHGTSEYQAAWIIDDKEDNDELSCSEDESDDHAMDGSEAFAAKEAKGSEYDEGSVAGEEMDSVTVDDNDEEKYDEKIDEEEEEEMRTKYRAARQDELFPDEVDTPLDVPARVRFARYRGLRSFNFSSWDPKENLPTDYSRIFQFQNFNRTKRRAYNADIGDDEERFCSTAGSFVRITIANVTSEMCRHFSQESNRPLVLYELLKHEQKMSVINVVLRKHPSCTQPIKSKERLIFHVGCRRFAASPIFSAHTNGTKFKYERFLLNDAVTVASMYAPITFPPASVVVFKEQSDGSHAIIATGCLLSVNPDRLVIKRAVLSGHPFKINKKLAVIRYMFFNKEDIDWFKPVELKTKYGRKGHIRNSLGTHGHMKCYFDRQINSMDTVLMYLYKRVFPKWTYDGKFTDPVVSGEMDD